MPENEKPEERELTAEEFAALITGRKPSEKSAGESLVEHNYSEFIFHFGANGPHIVAHWPTGQGEETVDMIKSIFKTFTQHVKGVAKMEMNSDPEYENGDPEGNGVPVYR